jgi:N6-adenosine-specific RNA methylase IME4
VRKEDIMKHQIFNTESTTKPAKKFAVIIADPPWDIAQKGARGAIQKYELMTAERIAAMPVADLAAENSTLLLWTTNAAMPAALEVMRSWNFEYKTNAIWWKGYMGLGNYFRNDHEVLLHGVRGKAPFKFHGQRSTFILPRQQHSRKPEEMIPLIERILDGPYLELFARQRPNSHEDWSVWGNEIESDISIPGYPVPADFTRDETGTASGEAEE